MKLVWEHAAIADRKEIRTYIERDNPRAALKLDELFEEKTALLSKQPYLGRPGRIPGTRELVAHHNYILHYTVTEETVCILRVLHAARQTVFRKTL